MDRLSLDDGGRRMKLPTVSTLGRAVEFNVVLVRRTTGVATSRTPGLVERCLDELLL